MIARGKRPSWPDIMEGMKCTLSGKEGQIRVAPVEGQSFREVKSEPE